MSPYNPHRSYDVPDANQHVTGSSRGMDTQLVDWSPTPFDYDQAMEIKIPPSAAPSVSKLSSSFSAKCTISPSQVIPDRFGSLPWFALEEILFNLPDLTTLHQLCQASPAVYEYLGDKKGIFPKVVEKIMDPWIEPPTGEEIDYRTFRDPDKGFALDTCIFFRTLVYLWWKEDAVATGVPADENPLPDDFNSERLYYVNISLSGFAEPPNIGEVLLPPSTPTKILRHLISLASRIRGDAHAFFHTAMKNLKSGKIEELSYKKAFWKQRGTWRPIGTPVHNSEAYWPFTWLEEQRVMQTLLKPYLFSVLRRVVCEKKLLTTNAPTPHPMREYYSTTLEDLEKNALVEFWVPFEFVGINGNKTLEQLETIITWKDAQKRLHGALPKQNAKFWTCCTEFTGLTYEQRKWGLEGLQNGTLPGVFLAQNSTHTVVRDAGLRGEFHKFGVSFWDNRRMLHLGLATEKMHREIDLKDLAFRWLTLLLSTKLYKKSGQERPNKFRCRTMAIPVAR